MKKVKRNLLLAVSSFLLVGGMYLFSPIESKAEADAGSHKQCQCNGKCKKKGSCCLKGVNAL